MGGLKEKNETRFEAVCYSYLFTGHSGAHGASAILSRLGRSSEQ
jgi:hypothetical protein